jgi:hypothetical protein
MTLPAGWRRGPDYDKGQLQMTTRYLFAKALLIAAAALPGATAFAQPYQPVELTSNAADTSRLVILPGGNFLTARPGFRPNHGTVFYYDSRGDFTWILLGLPGPAVVPWDPQPPAQVPDGLAALGNTLYIATGQVLFDGAAPDSTMTASILRVTFSRNLVDIPGPFFLQPSDYNTLLSGGSVTLGDGDNTATVTLLVGSVNGPTDLSVDAGTGRLYIVSRADRTISWVPLQ